MKKILKITASSAMLLLVMAISATAESVVSFTFDDAPKSVVTHALPILQEADINATAYLSSGLIGTPWYISWKEVEKLVENNWEIGAHTYSHPNLTNLNKQEIFFELQISTEAFRVRGYEPTTFAAPFGELDELSLSLVKQFYTSQRNAWGNYGLNELPVQDAYKINSLPLNKNMTMGEINTILDRLEDEGGWLVLQFHETGVKSTGEWSTALLLEIVNEVKSRGIKTATISEVLNTQ